jgi:CRP-like cAMP-binding protein
MTAQHLSDDLANNIGPVTCEHCDLAQICELLGTKPAAEGERHCAVLRFVAAGHTLYRAGESAKHFYAVRKGLTKLVNGPNADVGHATLLKVPGETLGLEAFALPAYVDDAIALTPTICCELPVTAITSHESNKDELASATVELLSRATTTRAIQLTGKASKRVHWFLHDLACRLRAHGLNPQRRLIHLQSQDLANVLDLHCKSVQRELACLERDGLIELHRASVRLLNSVEQAEPHPQ